MCETLTSNHLHTRYAGNFFIFSYKTFSEGYKQHYDRSAKGILSKPTRRFPHTRVVQHPPVTYNEGNKTLSTRLYSARLTQQEENKRLQGYARLIWLVGYYIYGSITKTCVLILNFISSHHQFINYPFYVSSYATFKRW